MAKVYKKRLADKMLADKLEAMGAVLIEGPKGCGKTTTAEQQAKSILYMDDPEYSDQYKQMAQTNIRFLLQGETPRLIDEWQNVPKFWDAIRFEVDHRDDDGQFMLTGSAVPPNSNEIHHTGTARYGWLMMRPMSLWESGDSNGTISLGDLFNSPKQIGSACEMILEQLAFLVCRGGWPKSIFKKTEKAALTQAIEYYEAITRADISRVDNVQRDEERAKRLMRSYSRHQGSQASIPTILADIAVNEAADISDITVTSYLNALKKIFVIEDMPAWNPNLRSKTAIRTSDTRYFVDPSISCAALGLGPMDLMNDLNTFGLFFETLCVRDLRVYADALDGKVYHYRDKNGLECDAVVHLRNGSYGLIEIKLGGDKLIEEGSKNLLSLNEKIDTTKMKAPAFRMVLTGVGTYAYRRIDGTFVVPIGCLKD
ncbi:ATP-binding protein [Limibacterium fermenti]|uniref:ATP-binding protein n=1 Tax=Limibacterium fermenti TaxID=3229863 RepID=UPI003A6EC3EE